MDYSKLAAFHDLEPELENFSDTLVTGLMKSPKSLPCKFFYDKRGSEIFDKICNLKEYYVTRTELSLLEKYSTEMLGLFGNDIHLVEFGSGSSKKIRKLLDSGKSIKAYTAIDISKEHLLDSCSTLADEYVDLSVSAICADYTRKLCLPTLPLNSYKKIGFFPGSSIGNFSQEEAVSFLKNAASALGSGSGLLVGIDLKKDTKLLEAAYNDKAGVTADFNLNLLFRAKKELGISFDLNSFQHQAVYNSNLGRIEMWLISKTNQSIEFRENKFVFTKGERIHTESSYKYSIDDIKELASSANYHISKSWIDANRLFSIHFLSLKN
tara:strand:+ start:3219 stop:4190 length:972 start_codon:yes stop_codon:yes gene_type:complete